MKGTVTMRSSKERKHERKRKHKEMGVARTEKSRARRLANKAKRDEILAINPDAKIIIRDQKTYLGYVSRDNECYVENGKIEYVVKDLLEPTVFIEPTAVEVKRTDFETGKTIDNQVEKERLGVFNPFKWKKK